MTGSLEACDLGAVTVAVHRHGRRSVRSIAVGRGRVVFFVSHDGVVDVSLEGRRITAVGGQGVVVTGPSLARISAADGAQSTVIDAPSVALSATPIPHRALLLIESSTVVRPANDFVRALLAGRHAVPQRARAHLESALVALVDAAITSSAAEKVQASSSLDRALSLIEKRYSDPALSAQAIADDVNVSLRQLERDFAALGRTIRQEIRRMRVLKAVALLRDPAAARLSVSSIAEQVGLSNGSSLARAMAAEGLASPRQHRATGSRGRLETNTPRDSISHRNRHNRPLRRLSSPESLYMAEAATPPESRADTSAVSRI
ncbi:hypothetical protein MICRO8M_50117 [Microbacterium sp. 8M]|uniref:helix-turn-helix domain-containing protein n=1 Tax=Microbacterium sp. 8M TaxID=2653153 RepID=UPI0012F42654|nr:helix-turn-helix domain-containing protein [Microbacterium sp. 8M]VXB73583.1 hypothetical protein MICRO8M_50117 [Microbacterium sp. 8M]